MLSNAYFLAKFRFDTAENEPAKNLQNFRKCIIRKSIGKTPADEPLTAGLGAAWVGVETWYLHCQDWELRAHELVSQRGTWLKTSVSFESE